ncbi:endocuticle structural glycoprotein ABD-5-like [Galleria mellonella]|uniref:Endocuticle structural glycoprotein ABD-5-like n=1 Tax=Galleria mellonella TaxID=7137 RepID=A0A6J3CCR3_GALME|nr:endocuticle structural glycoprotein ABD-5-like [Galleria mellonella]
MKIVVLLCFCAVAALSAPTSVEDAARRSLPALQHEEVHDDFGQYALRYITAEGIVVSERGRLVPTVDGKDHVLVYEGEYSFIGDDGKTYTTKYKTDVNGGFHVEGDHLPKAPVVEKAE